MCALFFRIHLCKCSCGFWNWGPLNSSHQLHGCEIPELNEHLHGKINQHDELSIATCDFLGFSTMKITGIHDMMPQAQRPVLEWQNDTEWLKQPPKSVDFTKISPVARKIVSTHQDSLKNEFQEPRNLRPSPSDGCDFILALLCRTPTIADLVKSLRRAAYLSRSSKTE